MAVSRKRRIVRRAVMALAVVVLLPVGYVGSAMMFCFAEGAGLFPTFGLNVALVVYAPLDRYVVAGLPGTDALVEMAKLAREAGRRFSE